VAGGILDVQGNEYCVVVVTGSGVLYGLSLTVQDTSSAFAGAQSGVASQQFEAITSLPLDSAGNPMRVKQVSIDTYQLIFVDTTDRVWTVSPSADIATANVFWQFANAGASISSPTTTLSPYAWIQNMFASAVPMPTASPAQPIAAPLAVAACKLPLSKLIEAR
jgi:hypothetical protein